MKKISLISRYIPVFLGLLLLFPWESQGQIKRERTVEKTVSMNTSGTVVINHRWGPLTIKYSNSPEVRMETVISVVGNDESEVEQVLSKAEVNIEEGSNFLDVSVMNNISEWKSTFNKTTIVFKDGTKIQGVKEINFNTVAYVPKVATISLSNKYEEIIFDQLAGKVLINLYDGNLKGGTIEGDFEFKTKYSEGEIGNVSGALDLDIYDSDINFGTSSSVTGVFKYSDCSLGNTGIADLEIYDSEIDMGSLNGVSKINDKYSSVSWKDCPEMDLQIYDSEVHFENSQKMTINSKYSEIEGRDVSDLKIQSYDDNFELGSIETLDLESKYSEFDIQDIAKSLVFITYDDYLEVNRFGNQFSKARIDGKYTEVELNMDSDASYTIEGQLKYGSIEYDEQKANTSYFKEKNSVIEIKAAIGSNASGKVIELDCYDCDVVIK